MGFDFGAFLPTGSSQQARPACTGAALWNRSLHTSALFSISQECDQVHIDDVASDDNGQDLR